MNGPKHLCVDRDGGVIIADTENHVIRKYSPPMAKSPVSPAAASAAPAAPATLPARRWKSISISRTAYMCIQSGDLYIADSTNKRILRIEREKYVKQKNEVRSTKRIQNTKFKCGKRKTAGSEHSCLVI